ncbi:DUF2793-containing protein [Candidatus Cyrtobacter comes]|uniref:DUF2793-containing protein n=1 Tax=Candidatus Cyrtobacter comes TaxID=675776 RepID=A0ABU5L8V4_9RICK|nr:DUF2793 domain-containing protein [Candidatus Cyrtobacter comes]MDZ5762546.1 DUF2793-containing protein [Candidatus Cyrtobacter comes]
MNKTNNYSLTYLEQYQGQKEVVVNDNMKIIDLLLHKCANSRGKDISEIKDPIQDSIFIIPQRATSVWSGKGDNIAILLGDWFYISPKEGMMFWVRDERDFIVYTGSAWEACRWLKK